MGQQLLQHECINKNQLAVNQTSRNSSQEVTRVLHLIIQQGNGIHFHHSSPLEDLVSFVTTFIAGIKWANGKKTTLLGI
jgi:hypothetical protein